MKKLLLPLLLVAGFHAAAQAPQLVADIKPGPGSGYAAMISVFNSKLYFVADDNVNGEELWSYSGSGAPALVYNLNAGAASGLISYIGEKMPVLNNRMYFSGNNGSSGDELYSYDGTNPPAQVADLNPGSGGSYPYHLKAIGSKLFFSCTTPGKGTELGIYDGTNTPSVIDISNGAANSNPAYFTGFNNKVYFSGITPGAGNELRVYDPATNSVSLVTDIVPGTTGSDPTALITYGNKLYFTAADPTRGRELYSYDGTTVLRLTDLAPGTEGGLFDDHYLIAYNNGIYFEGTTNYVTNGSQLYRYDPATNTTSLVYDINPGSGTGIEEMVVYHNKLYFLAYDGSHGGELWMHDGTLTKLVADLAPGPQTSGPNAFQVFNDMLYMSADNGTTGYELYRYNDGLGLTAAAFGGAIILLPNPTAGDAVLKLSMKKTGTYSITVNDAAGRLIWEMAPRAFAAGESEIGLPLQCRPPGTYFYQLRDGGRMIAAGKVEKR